MKKNWPWILAAVAVGFFLLKKTGAVKSMFPSSTGGGGASSGGGGSSGGVTDRGVGAVGGKPDDGFNLGSLLSGLKGLFSTNFGGGSTNSYSNPAFDSANANFSNYLLTYPGLSYDYSPTPQFSTFSDYFSGGVFGDNPPLDFGDGSFSDSVSGGLFGGVESFDIGGGGDAFDFGGGGGGLDDFSGSFGDPFAGGGFADYGYGDDFGGGW